MMRTAPQPGGWQLGPSLAAGLTLRFYKAFQMSASLTKLKERVAREEPEYEKYLIHVLVSTKAGELCKSFRFAQYQFIDAAERWHGACSMHPEKAFFEAEPAEGVHIVTAPGGSGMTLSFGLAERTMNGLGL